MTSCAGLQFREGRSTKCAKMSLKLTTDPRRLPIWDRCRQSVTGKGIAREREREREERAAEKTRFLVYCLLRRPSFASDRPRLGTLAKRRRTASSPEHSCGKMELGFEARPSSFSFSSSSLSPEFFHPNSSAALLNLRALEVAWTDKQVAGRVEVPERLA